MNTKPDAITVLCYGDSNTWGQKPDKTGRYNADIRWTGVLQEKLGDGYYIIEEGLSSRTTDLEYRKPGRNGKTYLVPCIASHNPLDIVVIMLGTNDLKTEFKRSVEEVAHAIHGLVGDVKVNALTKEKKIPRIIIVSPIYINSHAPKFKEFYTGIYDGESGSKSRKLATQLEDIAREDECTFVDASTVSESGIDGIHFSEESHPKLGFLLANTIKQLHP